ncbi:hypothetical protein ABU178_01550 [Pantoea osteomyelitidis]|uniref:Uncharacterized protein n=1 Tax=Pantoea osteomyelitidis TaxID=3230026 RepID=A0ABW7PRG1_9GAMM
MTIHRYTGPETAPIIGGQRALAYWQFSNLLKNYDRSRVNVLRKVNRRQNKCWREKLAAARVNQIFTYARHDYG